MIKMEIRDFCIRFSKRLAKSKKSIEMNLLCKLKHLNMRLDQNPQEANLAAEIEHVELDLQKIAEHKAKGAIIRSRARWYEHGERNTKYFMYLERRSHEKKHIVKLKTDQNEYVKEPNKILFEMEIFYKTLYASQVTDNTFDASAPSFLNLDNVHRLDNEQQKSCEGLITEEECLSSLKTFAKNKTPGSDGLLSVLSD